MSTRGRLLLRIEDIDRQRCTPALEEQMLEDLAWIGCRFDGTPRRQSEHVDEHAAALTRLEAMGLAYPAAMSRGQIRAAAEAAAKAGHALPVDPEGVPHYPGGERELDKAGRRRLKETAADYALRLDMARAVAMAGRDLAWREFGDETLRESSLFVADPAAWGDVILGRKSLGTSYHLACVLDDAVQGVTHVVRGTDLRAATSVHRLLQRLLDLPAPAYFHHRLVLDADGRKLSKSLASTGLRHLREAGVSPAEIRRRIGLALPDD